MDWLSSESLFPPGEYLSLTFGASFCGLESGEFLLGLGDAEPFREESRLGRGDAEPFRDESRLGRGDFDLSDPEIMVLI